MGNIYIYLEQNLRAYPGTVRGTKEWDSAYFSTNENLKTIKLWVIIALCRLSIKSSKCLENKGFIAMCLPYLTDVDKQAEERFERLVGQMKQSQGKQNS